MRYLITVTLIPVFAFAGCPVGNNYGSYPINSPESICMAFSGSSLGGCVIECKSLCLKLPRDNPTEQTPYMSTGQECSRGGGEGGGEGGGDGGGDGGKPNPNDGLSAQKVAPILVGSNIVSDLSIGFNAMLLDSYWLKNFSHQTSNNTHSIAVDTKQVRIDLNRFGDMLTNDTAAIRNSVSSMPSDLRVAKEYLASIDSNIAKLSSGGGSSSGSGSGDNTDLIRDILQNTYSMNSGITSMYNSVSPISGQMGGIMNMQGEVVNAVKGVGGNVLDKLSQVVNNRPWGNSEFAQMASKLDGIKKAVENSGGSGAGGDKPCKGPLCNFTKPSVNSGSSLSKVFSVDSIADVKKQIDNKDTEIKDAMNDVKSVFAPEQLSITGTYNNDYHDINGVKVDLSGKSNMELFFNSGPKMVIWFLAVLIAFSILMGGRKNA